MSHFNGTEQPPRVHFSACNHHRRDLKRRELPRSFHSPPALLRAACHRFIFNRAPHTMAPGAAHFAALLSSCLLPPILSLTPFLPLLFHLLLRLPFSSSFSISIGPPFSFLLFLFSYPPHPRRSFKFLDPTPSWHWERERLRPLVERTILKFLFFGKVGSKFFLSVAGFSRLARKT